MRLRLTLTDPATGTLIALPWHRATQATMETDEHGCAVLSVTLPLNVRRSLPLVSDGMGLTLACDAGARAIWSGRVEEPGIQLDETSSMLTLTAYGYQQAFDDLPYTALWSDSSYDNWYPWGNSSGLAPEKYTFDTNGGRLFLSPQAGTFGNIADVGAIRYDTPAGSSRAITQIGYDWSVYLPTNWKMQLVGYPSFTVYQTVTGNGALQTGTASLALNDASVYVQVYNSTGATATIASADNNKWYMRAINLSLKTAASVTPDAIVKDMLATVRATNSTQLSNVTSRIQVPGLTLPDESYIDANMRDVLDTLAGYGDSATPPNRYAWRVWADQVLRFEPLTTDTRTYTVSIGDYQADRALKQVYNQVYAAYQDTSGTRYVTSTANSYTTTAPRIIRRLALKSQGTTSTQAAQERDAALSDQGNPLPRVSMTITRLSDANGAPVPTWRLRAGDVVQVRDLAPTLSTQIDRFRSFRTIHTKLDLLSGAVDVDLESPQPQLDWLLARREVGL